MGRNGLQVFCFAYWNENTQNFNIRGSIPGLKFKKMFKLELLSTA